MQKFITLCKKNGILSIRNWKGTLGQLISPVLISLMLLGFQHLANYILARSVEFPPAIPVGPLSRCTPLHNQPCFTVVYAPKGVAWVNQTMQELALRNSLDFSKDFLALGSDSFSFEDLLADYETIYNYTANHPNVTQNAFLFNSAYKEWMKFPKEPGYILFYNSTDPLGQTHSAQAMRAVDEALLACKLQLEGSIMEKILLYIQSFPQPPLRVQGFDVVAAYGGIWFYIPPMIIFFVLLTEIVTEKELKLRLSMKMMGLKNNVYWASWGITGMIFVILSSLLLILSGYVCGFAFFTNSSFPAVFLLFFLFGVAMEAVAFFLSTLIRTAKTSQTIGYAIIMIGFVFQTILCSGYGILVDLLYNKDVAWWVVLIRWGFTVYPPFNMAKAFSDIAVLSSNTEDIAGGQIIKGAGFHWSDLFQSRSVPKVLGLDITVPPPINSYIFLLANAFLYFLLAWYLDNVLPGEHGSARVPYFFLLPSYWCQSKRNSKSLDVENIPWEASEWDSDVEQESNRTISIKDKKLAVRVVQMKKVFRKSLLCKSTKDVFAVNNVTFSVEKGEIFCLLGHNGAGKTTLISMLTGLFGPSSGNATIFGLDVETDMDEIQQMMGVCPQHDSLWNELTAKEHLEIFARLKGVHSANLQREINERLENVGLLQVGNHRVGTFSGGMKRRLSVAISTIGDPKLVFLDEPSTGMDPVNRLALWELIQRMKQDRAIILTTHSMEEADTLGDRIAIMAFGKLRCIGNSLHLKEKYGLGYRVHLITESVHADHVMELVLDKIPQASLSLNEAGSMVFNIPIQHRENIPHLLIELEKEAHEGRIREYGVSQSSLEEVFLQVTKKYDFVYNEELMQDEQLALTNSAQTRARDKKNPKSYPYRALIRKNLSIQKRQTGTNVCQICTPVFVIGIMLLLKIIIISQFGSQITKKTLVPSYPFPLNAHLNSSIPDPESEKLDGSTASNHCFEFFLFTAANDTDVGYLDNNGTHSELLGTILQTKCKLYNDTRVKVPYFEQRESVTAINEEIYNDLLIYNQEPLSQLKEPPLSYLLPDGFVNFGKISKESPVSMNFTVSVNDNPVVQYHRKNNFTRLDVNITGLNFDDELIILQGTLALISLIDDAFSDYVLGQQHDNSDPWFSLKWVQAMPYYSTAEVLNYLEAVGTLLYPLALSLQLPIYIYIIVMEKADKLKEFMLQHGLKTHAYITTNYLFFLGLYMTVIAFFWVSGLLIGIRFFTETNWQVLVVFFFGWGQALIALGFFFGAFLNSKRAASVVGYIIALFGSLMGLVVCVGIYGQGEYALSSNMPLEILVWPQFAFIRGIYLMNLSCITTFSCYGPLTTLTWENELTKVIVFMYCDAVVLFLVALYLDTVLPRQWGVAKHPLFFLECLKPSKSKRKESTALSPDAQLLSSFDEYHGDDDCDEEKRKVLNNEYSPEQYPLIIHNLFKQYGKHLAVQNLCLAVERGQCFGLLGENGAGKDERISITYLSEGKTTTISIITGMLKATSGHALIDGFDTRTQMDKVHLVIGVCPQFNVLWDELTVVEHLLFFARLKGIPYNLEMSHVMCTLDDFGLRNFAHRLASQLSGGMKRRLCVAIAMVGDSSIVILDEPTTGLDPVSRRQLWKIISHVKSKAGRAIVITTHSMEEAEVLCTKIGILAKGKLQCLGSPLHLKNKYTKGYKLLVNFHEQDAERVQKLIVQLFPGALERMSFKTSKEYRMFVRSELNKHDSFGKIPDVAEVFQQMETHGKQNGVTDWSFSQIGLEDVFINIVRKNPSIKNMSEELTIGTPLTVGFSINQ